MFSMRSALSPKVFSGNDNHYLNQIHLLCFRSELFQQDLKYKNISSAKRHYVFNALGFITKSFFWKRQSLPESNPFIMLSSYFKMAYRSLLAYKGNTIINVLGLVTGIASALVIFSLIRYELSFDSFHSNANNIYRLVRVTGTKMDV